MPRTQLPVWVALVIPVFSRANPKTVQTLWFDFDILIVGQMGDQTASQKAYHYNLQYLFSSCICFFFSQH